jgi:hypothetical protein
MEPQNGPAENPAENPGEQVPQPEPPLPQEPEPPPAVNPGQRRPPGPDPMRTYAPDRGQDRGSHGESIAEPLESEMKRSVLIQRWWLLSDWEEKNGLLVPIWMLGGSVFGHPKFPDGRMIQRTSAIVWIDGITVHTLSTVYRLGVAHHDFVIKREDFDPTDPLKGLILPSA